VLCGLHPGAVARAVMGDAAQEPDGPDVAAAGPPDVVEIVGAVVAPGRAVEVHAVSRITAGPQIVRAAAPDDVVALDLRLGPAARRGTVVVDDVVRSGRAEHEQPVGVV